MKNKWATRVLVFMMIFSIILPTFSVRNYATGTTAETEEVTTATPEEVKGWLNGMLGRSSGMFIDGTFKIDDYPDSKDGYFIVDDDKLPLGYSVVKYGGTEKKPTYALQNDSTGDKYFLQLKMKDDFGTRDMSEGLIEVEGNYYIDLRTSMNGGAKDFAGETVFLSLSKIEGSGSIDSSIVDLKDGQEFDKLCEVKTFDNTTPWYVVGASWILDPLGQALNLLERILTLLFMALGDGIVLMITNAVGEEVSLDRIIFNMVQKTSINFWEGGRSTTVNATGDNRLIPIVNDIVIIWYNVFRKIAITVYLIVLIYVAIRILLVSTSKEKEKYKDMFKNWVMGVGILIFFPFVMKYSIKINNVLVAEVGKSAIITKGIDPEKAAKLGDDAIGGSGFSQLNDDEKEGETKYAPNLMMYINDLAKRQGRLSLVFVYFIMIWQLITIIVLYYKRVFMLAFLITIFPLVTMTYTIDKLRR
jgi:hypothetical protein